MFNNKIVHNSVKRKNRGFQLAQLSKISPNSASAWQMNKNTP